MKKYSAYVKSGNRGQIVANREHKNKPDFIRWLREAGYKVNPKKVKEADLFEYITRYTAPWNWGLKEIPKEKKEEQEEVHRRI